MKTPFTGGCRCGAVRYRCTANKSEIEMFKCHCRDCQQFGGGGYSAVVFIPAASFEFTKGKPRYFTVRGDGGLHQRGFCAKCGSRLTGGENPARKNDHLGVTAASLDDPRGFKPKMEIYCAARQPWDMLSKGVRHFKKMPR